MATNGKKSRKKLIIISAIVVVLVALGLVVFLGSKKEPVLAVNVEKVTARTLTQVVTATGKIQRYRLSEVAAVMIRLHTH